MRPQPEPRAYFEEGAERAMELGNRGPLRLTDDGAVHPDIIDAYWRHSFYVFEREICSSDFTSRTDESMNFRSTSETDCRCPRAPESRHVQD